jgi:hypothetical protein
MPAENLQIMSQLAKYLKRWYPELDITLKPYKFKALTPVGLLMD